MPTTDELLQNIRAAAGGLSLSELMALHPTLARRSAQRLLSRMVSDGLILAKGEGRARRYYAAANAVPAVTEKDAFPAFIPLSADSKDILAYIDQPPEARKPVGYQRDFLDAYQPNKTWYLPEPLRRQLHGIGKTPQIAAPAGTYSRAILKGASGNMRSISASAPTVRCRHPSNWTTC